jgi:hypothetical protein
MTRRGLSILAALVGTGVLLGAALAADPFDHAQHGTYFVRCETCHAGVTQRGQPLWPAPGECAACHDGTIEKEVPWTPRAGALPSNLRFTHDDHARAFRAQQTRDSSLTCAQCHRPEGGKNWMSVERSVMSKCFECHQVQTAHFDAPAEQCATCHVPLWQAPAGVTAAQVATWKAPASHAEADFQSKHGALAAPASANGTKGGVSPACATCHARDYCITCHVNAPEVPEIQALQPDPRSLAMRHDTMVKAPGSHEASTFIALHGQKLTKKQLLQSCAACHTTESCIACHQVPPPLVRALAVAGPGRSAGVAPLRARPASHGVNYTDGHAELAAARPQTCAGCHVQEHCLQCHRPNGSTQGNFHPADYLSRHPVAAYSREVSCADCHNPGQFCQTCHQQNGLTSNGRFLGGSAVYHDADPLFATGHGIAARRGLESCVSCHAERDCMTCHSAVGGRRFNPHGPDFPAERLRKANPQMCLACHTLGIPGS